MPTSFSLDRVSVVSVLILKRVATIFTIAKLWNQYTGTSEDGQERGRYIYTMEYYSAIKRTKSWICVGT